MVDGNNIRILNDNKADSASGLAASSTASASLSVANLLTEEKTEVHRTVNGVTSVTYTWTWSDYIAADTACHGFVNYSSTATMRVRGYASPTAVVGTTVPDVDTGDVLCCAYQPTDMFEFGVDELGVNGYAYGGFAYAIVWFATTMVRKIVIDVIDADNASGYLEAGRAIIGAYWSPDNNAEEGAGVTPKSNTKGERMESGNVAVEDRPKSRTLDLDLTQIRSSIDRQKAYSILRGNGMVKPLLISLYPEDEDPSLEQSGLIWGRLASDARMSNPKFGQWATSMQIEEV